MRLSWRACFLQAAALCLLVGVSHAAGPVFGDGLRSVPWFSWAVVFAMSTMSGLVALLNRVLKELNRNGQVRWPAVFAGSHMTGSWLAGLIAFLMGLSGAWSEWLIDLGVILASFGGAVFIEKMADRWLSSKLGYDTTAPVALSPPESRSFADTRPGPRPAPKEPPLPPLPGFAPLDDG